MFLCRNRKTKITFRIEKGVLSGAMILPLGVGAGVYVCVWGGGGGVGGNGGTHYFKSS